MPDDYASLWLWLAGLRIMLIAHDPWIKNSLAGYFKSNGCDAYAPDSGREGLEALAEKPFDIVIADFSLPDMSGFDFLRQCLSKNPHSINMLICPGVPGRIPPEAASMGIRIIEKPFKSDAIDRAFLNAMKEQENTTNDR
ncbi:MAG: response regulator [Deltaproteobacteria bacterium]|nr:response regulator [Deltaproteobacteria bacterium]NIS78355.1 response regulator [Deltaproteobacteria bacterium]